jgi:hypothetical protein
MLLEIVYAQYNMKLKLEESISEHKTNGISISSLGKIIKLLVGKKVV